MMNSKYDLELLQFRATQNESPETLMQLAAALKFSGDEKQAFEVASKAAYTYRSPVAYSYVGEALLKGRGVARDLDKGVKALKRAISLGDDVSRMILKKLQIVA